MWKQACKVFEKIPVIVIIAVLWSVFGSRSSPVIRMLDSTAGMFQSMDRAGNLTLNAIEHTVLAAERAADSPACAGSP